MQLHKLAAVVAAVLLVTAGAAVAAPGNGAQADGRANASTSTATGAATPAEPAEQSARDAAATETAETPERTGENDATGAERADGTAVSVSVSARGNASGAAVTASADAMGVDGQARSDDERGPPGEMPDDAPSHVERIHDLIRERVAGTLGGSLGDVIGGVLGGGQADARADENATRSGDQAQQPDRAPRERGPRTDRPDNDSVPSHVERIHVMIRERLSGVLSGDGSEVQGSANASADATATQG